MLVKRLGAIVGAAIVSVLSLSAVAQADEQFLVIGTDSDGVPFKLDTTTMGKKERGFGEVIKIYRVKGNYMHEYMLHAGCADKRLWQVGHRMYIVPTAEKISEEKEDTEIPANGNSPGATAMNYYCKAVHASGW